MHFFLEVESSGTRYKFWKNDTLHCIYLCNIIENLHVGNSNHEVNQDKMMTIDQKLGIIFF